MDEYKTMATAERFLQLAEEAETESRDKTLSDIARGIKYGMEIAYRDAAQRIQWATDEEVATVETKGGA